MRKGDASSRMHPLFCFFLKLKKPESLGLRSTCALLLDTSLLTRELAQVVQLGAANLTMLVDFDALNVRRLNGEDTLHTHGTRHFTNGEALLLSST